MLMLIRHLLAIIALPFVVAVAIPLGLARRSGIRLASGDSLPHVIAQALGVAFLLIGFWLFLSSLQRFAADGKGTLAPWDPPRQLVLRGPYRFVRNPMISGVVFVLFGEGLVLLSRAHLLWALTFFVINCIYIPLLEEPMLKARFGDAYTEYCRHVPRLIPRLRPWDRAATGAGGR